INNEVCSLQGLVLEHRLENFLQVVERRVVLKKRRSKDLELVQMAYERILLAYEHPYQSSQNSGRRVEPVIGALTEEVGQMRLVKVCFQLSRKLSDDTNKKHRLALAC